MDTSIAMTESLPVQAAGKRFGVRAVAYIIDLIVHYVVHFAVAFVDGVVIAIVLTLSGRPFSFDGNSNQCLGYAVVFALITLYFTVFEWLYGATPGKLVLGMRVIKENGSPCDLKAAFVRALIRFLDGLFFGVPAYASMKAPLYQRVGDKHAKTLVVSSKDAVIRQPRMWWWFLIAAGLYVVLDTIATLFLVITLIR